MRTSRRTFLRTIAALGAAGGVRVLAAPPADGSIVILISIDGFRSDYLQRDQPPALMKLAEGGVRADGLIPQFPSKTFPNHYTLVTGLRPAHHGIVANTMVSPSLPGRFSMSRPEVIADGRWWGGEPIWNSVERQGRVAAAMFWPGSEARIGDHQATFWKTFDDKFPDIDRVSQVLEWLRLPDDRRPSFLTLYFSDVDVAGHDFGPDTRETRDAVARVDASIAALVSGIRAQHLESRVNYVIVSDHGMAAIPPDHFIVLDDYLDVAMLDVIESGPLLLANPRNASADSVLAALKGRHPALAIYGNSDIPPRFGLAGNPRLPAIIGIADEGWFVTTRREQDRWRTGAARTPRGTHGYDPALASMRGLFIAAGPSLRAGVRPKAFENIHVYDLMCALLGIAPAPNDGDPAVTRGFLR